MADLKGVTKRPYMTEADVGTERDPPLPMIIQVDAMTIEQARNLGPVLRRFGVTGRFIGGTIAENMLELAKLKQSLERGGDKHGDKTLH